MTRPAWRFRPRGAVRQSGEAGSKLLSRRASLGLDVRKQRLPKPASSASDEFRLVVLVAVIPLRLVFLSWQELSWREQRLLAG